MRAQSRCVDFIACRLRSAASRLALLERCAVTVGTPVSQRLCCALLLRNVAYNRAIWGEGKLHTYALAVSGVRGVPEQGTQTGKVVLCRRGGRGKE